MDDPRQGEVWWVDVGPAAGTRPALILTRNSILRRLSNVTVAPITSVSRRVPSEVELTPAEDGVDRPCVVSLDNITTIPKEMLVRRQTALSADRMNQVWEALHFAFDLPY